MNASSLAHAAYTSSAAPVRTERSTEYDIFSRITQRLTSADPAKDYPGMVTALHENRQLWTLLAVDVADADNGLPQQLRAQLFYLAEFTIQHTSKILAGDGDIADLVEVNTAVMRGLHQQVAPK